MIAAAISSGVDYDPVFHSALPYLRRKGHLATREGLELKS